MGVNITSSSRAEIEFEECPYCHSESSAVQYEYITSATGAWDVVKYTCLKCASQFIYDCRAIRPRPILVHGSREDWLHEYTTESEMWRDRLGYKRIEKPKEESMGCTDDAMSNYEKFKQPAGSIVEFEGESYVVRSDEAGLVTCDRCDLLGECSINNWPELCEGGKYYKKVKESDMILAKDVCRFTGDDFDKKVKVCSIGDTMELNGKTYKAVDQAPYNEGCYDCDLCNICQYLHFGGEFCAVCDPAVIFKEVTQKEEANDDVAIFHDYSKDPFEKLFEFRVGFKFRYGNKMYEVANVANAPTTEFHCKYDCALYEECSKAADLTGDDCPDHRYFKECNAKSEESKKEETKPVDMKKDYSTGDFNEIFRLNEGDEFRFGDSIYKAMSKDPREWGGCNADCDLYDYCYDEDGSICLEACPGSRYCKRLGYVFNRCPSCGEYALKACLNAARSGGVSEHVLNVSMVPGGDGIPEVDKQEIEHMTDAATVVCTICGSRHGSLGSWKQQFKPVHSFIDDGDKLVDFFKLTKEEFLKSYSYLTEEEYEATLEAIKSRTK